MDTILITLSSFIVLIIILSIFRTNAAKRKGARGEARVARRLYRLRGKEYKVFNDVLISTARGSSQIDHIVVSVYGIFVIETKNYKGWIHGHENSEYWKQTIYRKKTKITNPVKQNWAHIYALKKVLKDFNHAYYHPIVVFAGSAELKNIHSNVPVIYDRRLIRTIRKISIPNLSIEDVNKIAAKLNAVSIEDKKAIKQHIRYAKTQASERERRIKSKLCPRCGAKLVLRKGKYGKFYGCSNYPKCKYTLDTRVR